MIQNNIAFFLYQHLHQALICNRNEKWFESFLTPLYAAKYVKHWPISLNNACDTCGIQHEKFLNATNANISFCPAFQGRLCYPDIPYLTFLKPACLCTVVPLLLLPRVGWTFFSLSLRSQTSMQTGAIYNKPVQFPPSSIQTTALTSAKSFFISYNYCTFTTWPHSCIFVKIFGLSSFSLPVRCFLCVRWILLVNFCMHVYCLLFPSLLVHFLTSVLLAAQPALHVASGHTPGPTNALELEVYAHQRSSNLHFPLPPSLFQSQVVFVIELCAQFSLASSANVFWDWSGNRGIFYKISNRIFILQILFNKVYQNISLIKQVAWIKKKKTCWLKR